MILKSLSRHSSKSYMNLVQYILNPEKSKDGKPDIIAHNLRSKEGDKVGYVQEFKRNESYRKQQRQNSVKIYHTIISLGANESPKVATRAVLQDLALKYMELKGHDRVYLAAIHSDKDHFHCHIAESGLKYCSSLSSRISRVEFQNIKTELEKYQRQQFPELTESIVNHGSGKAYLKDRTWQKTHRQDREIQKQELSARVTACFEKSRSQKEFLQRLQTEGLSHYERGTTAQGILTAAGHKFRFTRLNVDINQLPIEPTTNKSKNMKESQTLDRSALTPFQLLAISEMNDCQRRIENIRYEKDAIYAELFDNESQFFTKEQQEKLDSLQREENLLFERNEGLLLTLENEGVHTELRNEIELNEDSQKDIREEDYQEIDSWDDFDSSFPIELDDEFKQELDEMESIRDEEESEHEHDEDEFER